MMPSGPGEDDRRKAAKDASSSSIVKRLSISEMRGSGITLLMVPADKANTPAIRVQNSSATSSVGLKP